MCAKNVVLLILILKVNPMNIVTLFVVLAHMNDGKTSGITMR